MNAWTEKRKRECIKEAGGLMGPVSQIPSQSKTSVRRIWWRLFIWGSFYEVYSDWWKERERCEEGPQRPCWLIRRQKWKSFSCHIWVTLNWVTPSVRCSERPFFKIHGVIFLSVSAPVFVKKMMCPGLCVPIKNCLLYSTNLSKENTPCTFYPSLSLH